MSAYKEALEFTLGREGGYYDGSEARDPNPTNFGVTQKVYDNWRKVKKLPIRPVKQIEQWEVEAIYVGYWEPAGCHMLGRLSSITLFDHSINAGPANAVKVLQRALGVTADGKIGPKTRAAIEERADMDAYLATNLCWERVRYYVDLAKNARLRPNLLSWVHRVVLYREKYLK